MPWGSALLLLLVIVAVHALVRWNRRPSRRPEDVGPGAPARLQDPPETLPDPLGTPADPLETPADPPETPADPPLPAARRRGVGRAKTLRAKTRKTRP